MKNKIITSFGSSTIDENEDYYFNVVQIGKLLSEKGYTVCSGGYAGTMQAISKGAKSSSGKTIGITVSTWTKNPNPYIDEEVRMPNLIERIMELIAIADAYIVFKGGTGTLVELSVTLELMNQKSIPEKPIILFGNSWAALVDTLKQDSAKVEELISRNIKIANTPDDVVKFLV